MEPIVILKVDLNKRSVEREELPDGIREKYIGGVGLATHLLFESGAYAAEPLSAENTFVLTVGPLAGTMFGGTSRLEIAFRSPLTGGLGSASAGGFFGPELKNAGLDGIVITGASESPVYLHIENDTAEIRDAAHLWGKDTYAVEETLREETGNKNLRVACIGQAGENLVKFAAFMGGRHNFAARGGPGAVLGAKKFKAIAVKSDGKREVADPARYQALRKKIKEKQQTDVTIKAYSAYGTDSTMQLGMLITDVPTKNWRVADWTEGSDKLNGVTMEQTILSGRKSCHACFVGCKRVVTVKEGKYKTEKDVGPEYETAASMGTLLLNDDLAVVTAANRLCNMYGLDTISAGSTIAFAMEAFDNGIITEKDTDGLALKWGDADAILKLIEKIAMRDGIGDTLAEGTKRAAEKLGKGAEEFAIQSKGMELPMHDPRAYHGLGLAYAVSNRGACHIKHLNIVLEMGVYKYPEFGLSKPYPPLKKENKAEMTARSEELGFIISSLALCCFTAWPLSPANLAEMLDAVEGLKLTPESLQKTGERIWHLQRAFNVLCGLTAEDDTLPRRVLEPHPEGEISGLDNVVYGITKQQLPSNPRVRRALMRVYDRILPNQAKMIKNMGKIMFFKKLRAKDAAAKGSPDLDFMKRQYYELRELDSRGVPSKKKLEELGLEKAAEKVQ